MDSDVIFMNKIHQYLFLYNDSNACKLKKARLK